MQTLYCKVYHSSYIHPQKNQVAGAAGISSISIASHITSIFLLIPVQVIGWLHIPVRNRSSLHPSTVALAVKLVPRHWSPSHSSVTPLLPSCLGLPGITGWLHTNEHVTAEVLAVTCQDSHALKLGLTHCALPQPQLPSQRGKIL